MAASNPDYNPAVLPIHYRNERGLISIAHCPSDEARAAKLAELRAAGVEIVTRSVMESDTHRRTQPPDMPRLREAAYQ